jgi:hypothetical protein
MKTRRRLNAGQLLLFLSVLSVGCQHVYRGETVWHADGSIDRAIYQESNATPEAVRRPDAWKQTTYAPDPPRLERQGWSGPISKLPLCPSDGDHSYFAAWGRFRSAQDIPDHVVFKSPEGLGLPDGQLLRDCRQTDYVFVHEYLWRETLTDIVRLDDMRQAREELAESLVDLWQEAFNQTLGKEYDATDLARLVRSEGKAWFAEMTDYAFVHCATHKGPAGRSSLWDGIAAICAGHGLPLRVQGRRLAGEEQRKAIEDFAIGKLCHYVHRKKDGKPLDQDTAAYWLAESKGDDQHPGTVFQTALKNAILAKYATETQFDRWLGERIVRVCGLHGFPFFDGHRFDYSLTVPGQVLETTGQLLSANRVRWQFDTMEAYPLGYTMECRSLLLHRQTQKELLPDQPLDDREAQFDFVSIVRDRKNLVEALRKCRANKSLTPLYEFRQRANGTAGGEQDVKSVDRLLKLCKLPQTPPKDGK